jgi:hypothetical protein
MAEVKHLGWDELHDGLGEIRSSPGDNGILRLIVRRPQIGEREVLQEGVLDLAVGLVGDNWGTRGCPLSADGSAQPQRQITIMNARAAALVAQDSERWQLAGDQLFLDMDLSGENLPPGTRLALGSAVIEVSEAPHTGCRKFVARFGHEAMKFVNSPVGRQLNLRGINARVVRPGVIRVGDVARKIDT